MVDTEEITKEPLDRNKTDLTHRITALAWAYLLNRGFRPIEVEVSLPGYGVADIASFVLPTPTETGRLRLANVKRFGLGDMSYGELMFHYGPMLTAVVEVKTSRADFHKDLSRKFRVFPAHLCYLAYPKDMILARELPSGWMGLEATSNAGQLRRRYWNHPTVHQQHPGEVAEFLAQLALRCDNRTKYGRSRLMLKMYRAGGKGV